ncbi:MAG: hypothetical protein FWC24_01210 [Treponema sp.]|nr:hypothetical protein [Treponema sp.]
MKKGLFVKTLGILLILGFFSGCALSTKMTVNALEPNGKPVNDAVVMVDGINIGQTPNARKKVSNFVGTTPEIIIVKDGYEVVRTEAVKEVKAANLITGIFLLNVPAWFWVYGPKSQQNIILTPETAE